MGTWWPVQAYSRAVAEFADEGVEVARLEFQARMGGSILEHLSDGSVLPWGVVIAWDPPRSVLMAWRPHSKPEPPTEVEVNVHRGSGRHPGRAGASGVGPRFRRVPPGPV